MKVYKQKRDIKGRRCLLIFCDATGVQNLGSYTLIPFYGRGYLRPRINIQ